MGIEGWLERLVDIPEIVVPDTGIRINDIRDLSINVMPDWMRDPPQALPIYPPVSTQVGVPIVNIPGCVESHRDSSENQTLKDEDKDGVQVFCDAGTPSYSPLDYDPRRLEITTTSPPPPPYKPPDTKPPAAPDSQSPPPPSPAKAECPSRAQELKNPIGKILEGNKKITGYETVGSLSPGSGRVAPPSSQTQTIPGVSYPVRQQSSSQPSSSQVSPLLTKGCLLYTSPSPRDLSTSRMPSSA